MSYVILGTGLLWFGRFGFNAGSALGSNLQAIDAFVATNMASASAMLTWVLFEVIRGNKPSAMGACVGAVVGLVAITPAAGYIEYGPSIFIGCVSAIISNYAVHWKNHKSDIDDTLDVFPCHGVGGAVGMLMTGLLANTKVNPLNTTGNGLLFGEFHLFNIHLMGLVLAIVFVVIGSFLILKITDIISPMTISQAEKNIGSDLSQHGEQIQTFGKKSNYTKILSSSIAFSQT